MVVRLSALKLALIPPQLRLPIMPEVKGTDNDVLEPWLGYDDVLLVYCALCACSIEASTPQVRTKSALGLYSRAHDQHAGTDSEAARRYARPYSADGARQTESPTWLIREPKPSALSVERETREWLVNRGWNDGLSF